MGKRQSLFPHVDDGLLLLFGHMKSSMILIGLHDCSELEESQGKFIIALFWTKH